MMTLLMVKRKQLQIGKKIGRKQSKANEDSDVINSQQETSIQTRRRGRRKTKVEDDRKISGSDKAKCVVGW